MINNVYTCILKDGKNRIVLQPFIAYDDFAALQTVKNAIRENENIRTIALQERISMHKLCEIDDEVDSFVVHPHDLEVYIGDNEYFKRYSQVVFADEARQKSNEMEASNNG